MRWRGPVVDAAAATVATLVTLAILAQGGLGTPDSGRHAFDEPGLLLTLASSLPLAVARRWPGVVFTVSAVSTIVLIHLRYPLDVPLGPLYAAYVLVLAWGGAGPLRRGLAAVGVVAYVPVMMAVFGLSGVNVWAITTEMCTWGLAMVGMWLAAERTRLRQSELEAAEERATRTEREAERENRLAAAEERTRIARELHDSAGHAINVILVQAGAARLLHERDPAESLRAISTVEDVARATIIDIDRMVHALRSAGGEPVPADPAALEELLEHHRRSGLHLATTFGGERRPLPRSVAWASYRILQEALTNAARHGSGSAEVVVDFGPHAMEIAVTNPATTVDTTSSEAGAHADPEPANGSGTTVAAGAANGHRAANGTPEGGVEANGVAADGGTAVVVVTPRDASPLGLPRTRAENAGGVALMRVGPAVSSGGSGLYRPNGGHGLIGIRERATLLGGTFDATVEAGVFRVHVRLPYDAMCSAS